MLMVLKNNYIDKNGECEVLRVYQDGVVVECENSNYQNYEVKNKENILERYLAELKNKNFKKLENIFEKKLLEIEAFEIEQPWLINKETIKAQRKLYDDIYYAAKNGTFDEDTNTIIINKYESMANKTAIVKLYTNRIKSFIRDKIQNNEDVSNLFVAVEKAEITDKTIKKEALESFLQKLGDLNE